MGRPKKIKELTEEQKKEAIMCQSSDTSLHVPVEPTKEQKEKKQRLLKLINEVNRDHKKIVIRTANEEPNKTRAPFGIKEVDDFCGGGIHGNFIIIWGSESVGKSSLCLYQVAEAQKQGKLCAYLDLEHAFDKNRAKLLGVNLDDLFLAEDLDTAEQAMDLVIRLAKDKAVDLIIVDSIQAMTPKGENENKSGKERSMEEDEIALLAKKMGKFLRRTATPIYQSQIAVTLVGQSRTGGIGGFATHEELTGGRATKHYSLLTLFMRKGQGVDAPTEKVDSGELDDKDKPIKITKKVGFDSVIVIQKTKVESKPELSELHLPFYFNSAFTKKT